VTPEAASPDLGIAVSVIVLALLLAGIIIVACRILDDHRDPAAEDPADAETTLAGIDQALGELQEDGWRL
jgi:hypothetical protein